MSLIGNMSVKQLYRWIEDQIADWGDEGVAWEMIVTFGKQQVGIDPNRLDCAIADLLNARRLVRRGGKLIVK